MMVMWWRIDVSTCFYIYLIASDDQLYHDTSWVELFGRWLIFWKMSTSLLSLFPHKIWKKEKVSNKLNSKSNNASCYKTSIIGKCKNSFVNESFLRSFNLFCGLSGRLQDFLNFHWKTSGKPPQKVTKTFL